MPRSQSARYEIMILRLSLYATLTFPNFRASSTYSTEVKRESTTSLCLPLPSSNMIKGGFISL
jgi:hypothetical protein